MPTPTSDNPSAPQLLADWIKDTAKDIGFDYAGITSASTLRDQNSLEKLTDFLDQGYHGTMGWMETRAAQRADPQTLWPDAQSVIMLGLQYTPEFDPLSRLSQADRGVISTYAHGADYHDVIKKKLKRLARALIEKAGGELKVFVDTAPVMEKPLGAAAGLGWQGKHTNLVSRDMGNWFFLGAIFTSLDLPTDPAETDHCGNCTACQNICPTNAFPAPYQLDARRCISYLTIEHDGQIDAELRPLIGNHIYGCDDCLAVCPWNKFAQTAHDIKLAPKPERDAPALADLVTLDDAQFREMFRGSPIKRTGRDRFVRNVLIAIGNSGDAQFAPLVKPLLHDDADIVRGMAVWALKRLLPEDQLIPIRTDHLLQEQSAAVLSEWTG